MRLEVTRKSDLAVRAVRVLAETGGRMKGPALAGAVGSTPGFVSQVVNPLVRQGWVRSDPGPTGGYSLAVGLDEVSVLAVIEAIEGPTASGRCVLADRPCDETGTCALHVPWLRARALLLRELAATSLADRCEQEVHDDPDRLPRPAEEPTMSETMCPTHRQRDLDTRDEIAEFVTRFYREIAQDDRFHHWFETIAHVDWHAHTGELTDFWTGVLLDEPHRSPDEVIEAHRWLHDTDPFDQELFDRWLEILDTTLDAGWSGPMAETARRRGHGIAWAMSKRLTGGAARRLP